MILSRANVNKPLDMLWPTTQKQSKPISALRAGTVMINGIKQALTESVVSNIQTYSVSNKINKVKWIDEEGEIAPTESTQSYAKMFISDFYRSILKSNIQWNEPLTNASPNEEIVFEWWNQDKKLTIYCKQNSLEFIKIWGADIETEMDDGEVSAENLPELAEWLWS